MDTIFLEPEQEALLDMLVQAHERLPRSERQDFKYSRAYIRNGAISRTQMEQAITAGGVVGGYKGGPFITRVEDIPWNLDHDMVFHNGLSGGGVDIIENDLDILRLQGLIHFKNDEFFFITLQGIAFHRKSKSNSNSSSSAPTPQASPPDIPNSGNRLLSFDSNDLREANINVSSDMAGNDLYKDNTINISVGPPYHIDNQETPFADLTPHQRKLIVTLAEKMKTDLYIEEFRGVRLVQRGWVLYLSNLSSQRREQVEGFSASDLRVLSEEGYISLVFTDSVHCEGALKQKAYRHYHLWKSQQSPP